MIRSRQQIDTPYLSLRLARTLSAQNNAFSNYYELRKRLWTNNFLRDIMDTLEDEVYDQASAT